MARKPLKLLALIGPGLLVAATGVGAGDLSTGAFTGAKLGLAVLWAIVLGAFFKFVLNEGLARWQLATGDTLLEGAVHHLGRGVRWFFLVYLVVWSFLVGAALMSAIGVTGHAIFPLFGNVLPLSWLPTSWTGWTPAQGDKVLYGLFHSALAAAIIRFGGYRLFERVMGVCIAVMFVVVIGTAIALQPPPTEVAKGLFLPSIPSGESIDPAVPTGDDADASIPADKKIDGLGWTIALMGGVGGTVTVLCYGYWIREEGREGVEALKTCRVDLATAYAMTALFGMAMLVIGSQLPEMEGKGARLMVELADQVERKLGSLGTVGRWGFLIGAWGAVFSSLLGVWQSVPYLFADFWNMRRHRAGAIDKEQVNTRGLPYRVYLWGIATVPILGLTIFNFELLQKVNAIVGALFIPMLAITLLILNGNAKWVGQRYRNQVATIVVLIAALLFFLLALALTIRKYL